MSRNWLWYVLLIFVFLIAVEFVVFLIRGKPYEMTSYDMKFLFDSSGNATITTHTVWRFKNAKDARQYVEAFTQNSTEVTEKAQEDLRKVLSRNVKLVSVNRNAELKSERYVQITEDLFLANMADVSGGRIKVMFGDAKLKFPLDTSLVYVFPEGYEVTLAIPTPTQLSGNVALWKIHKGEEEQLPVAVAEEGKGE